MTQLVWDAGFKRAYKKRIGPDALLKLRFWDALEQFESDPFSPGLRTHPLTGKLHGLHAFSVDVDCRVVFRFIKANDKVLLIEPGKGSAARFRRKPLLEHAAIAQEGEPTFIGIH